MLKFLLNFSLLQKRNYGVAALSMMRGKTFINKSGAEINADQALKNKSIITLYFSASWCNPCKGFLPVFRAIHNKFKSGHPGSTDFFEIIYISSDTDANVMLEYYQTMHGEWLAVPFQSTLSDQLREHFGVESIPQIIVINKDDKIISDKGRKDVEDHKDEVINYWKSKDI